MCESWNWFLDYYTILNAIDLNRERKEIEIEDEDEKKKTKNEINIQFVGWQKALHIYLSLSPELDFPQYLITQLMIMYTYSFRSRVYLCSVFMGKLSLIFVHRCFRTYICFGVAVVDRNQRRGNNVHGIWRKKKRLDFQRPSVFIRLKYSAQNDTSHARWNQFKLQMR